MNPHQLPTFVFFGIAGSGKGTQVALLEKYVTDTLGHDVVFASPGTEYRKMGASGSYTGLLVKEIIDRGSLEPNFLTNSLVISAIATTMTDNSAIIADGYPRTIEQSQELEKMFTFYGRSPVHLIYIEVSKEEALKRMKLRARADDTDAGIAQRFDDYIQNVLPAMNYFKDKEGYGIHTINGEQSIEEVHAAIMQSLGF